jgi:hypothetical protein
MRLASMFATVLLLPATPALADEAFNPFDALADGMSRADGARYLEAEAGPVTRTLIFSGGTFAHKDPKGDLVVLIVDKPKASPGIAAMVFCRDKLIAFDVPIKASVAKAIVAEKGFVNQLPTPGSKLGNFSMELHDGSLLYFQEFGTIGFSGFIGVSYPHKSMVSGDFSAYCPVE